jgi:hypothetical protein
MFMNGRHTGKADVEDPVGFSPEGREALLFSLG